jgi:hypothetical protein
MSTYEADAENLLITDEQTTFLPASKSEKPTALPRFQISILLLLLLAEPITSQCILPFINEVEFLLLMQGIKLIEHIADK